MAEAKLKNKRASYEKALDRHKVAVEQFNIDNGEIAALKRRVPDVKKTFEHYTSVQDEIEERIDARGNEEELVIEQEERERFEKKFYSTLGAIDKIVEDAEVSSKPKLYQREASTKSQEKELYLEPLPLPTFSGEYRQWFTFYQSFSYAVHNDLRMPNIQKFHYLKSCLMGQALEEIESLQLTDENYEVALAQLKHRFENKRLIAQECVTNILNLNPLLKSSASALRKLATFVNVNVETLKSMKQPVDSWDAILIPIVSEKIDFYSRREWHATVSNSKEIPTWSEFKKFVDKRCNQLESMEREKTQTQKMESHKRDNTKSFKNHSAVNMVKKSFKHFCVFCNSSHNLHECEAFQRKEVPERMRFAHEKQLCNNCLRKNHSTEDCRLTVRCKTCGEKHHTLLHVGKSVGISAYVTSSREVLLSTVRILVADARGGFKYCRALLDVGSEVNLISKQLAYVLKLQITKNSSYISGINGSESKTFGSTNVVIKSATSDFTTTIQCVVIDGITRPTPSSTLPRDLFKIPEDVVLADPEFNKTHDIDLLIGVTLFYKLLTGTTVQIGEGNLFMQNTRFGWIVGGEILTKRKKQSVVMCNFVREEADSRLHQQVARFWQDEEVMHETSTESSEYCEQHFKENVSTAESRHFIVKLPFREDNQLGKSDALARRQFFALEARFSKNLTLKEKYVQFMDEYLHLNHMEEVPVNEVHLSRAYYLPHHPVYKITLNGPKIRVVFNASARTSNGRSLNDILWTGPVLHNDIFSILSRFRTHRYVLNADIEKMYRMILVHRDDQDFQRILWRNSENQPLKVYRLRTVTYGLKCGQFLAVRSVHQAAEDVRHAKPKICEIIKNDMYVDDLLTGCDSIEELIEIRRDVQDALAARKFNLCKWASNVQLNTGNVMESTGGPTEIKQAGENEVKVLGFLWQCSTDMFFYKARISDADSSKSTKRTVLAAVARIFDPLGLINPVIVMAKVLLQKIWSTNLDWDAILPDNLQNEWTSFCRELAHISLITIPRSLVTENSKAWEIHGFADASAKAYGAVVYLRALNEQGYATVKLMCAKSRVAPLRTVTLPRLELNAAHLLTILVKKVTASIKFKIDKIHMWTDSMVALCWIAESSSSWTPYVASRVSKIQENSRLAEWRHVRSGDNPADLVSRGTYPKQLADKTLWWCGPLWLQNPKCEWPLSLKIPKAECPERRINSLTCMESPKELEVITRIGYFKKLTRIVAYCLRFAKNCKKFNFVGHLQVEEIEDAKSAIIKHIQACVMQDERRDLQQRKMPKNLIKLDPFLDSSGIIRVGGRLRNSDLPYEHKFPIILPAKHHIVDIIIRHFHLREQHAGCEGTLAALRQEYWPIAARSTVKRILHNCVPCFRAGPRPLSQKMGDLPRARVHSTKPFVESGVDYAGPIFLKEGGIRSRRKVKAYIALFVCMATKAVHLELVSSLTSEGFIATLGRFISRRGRVARLFSDNGTNFVGADRELMRASVFQDKIEQYATSEGIEFKFIPPRSPHFGGLWERAVRSVKTHLRRIVADASLTYEEFYTVLTKIEACLNSRPITPLSNDPNDYEPLTPGHFLVGGPLTAPVERDLQGISQNRLSRWQRITQIQQHFWSRWHREYLSQLQYRPRQQCGPVQEITTGAMVLLVDEDIPPLKWAIGRIQEIHAGADGIVRVATVRTSKGTFKRAVKKLCLLPTDC